MSERYGKWTTLTEWEPYIYMNAGYRDIRRRFLCVCDCGCFNVVLESSLKSGRSTSCKCSSIGNKFGEKHGLTHTRTWDIWSGMKVRCNNGSKYHGARGIKYQDSWELFENFLKDMGEAPADLSLDRIDTNGDYTVENCRWADDITQNRNIRRKSNNTSGRTGVHRHPCGKWVAKLDILGESHYSGLLLTKQEAIDARVEMEIIHYGKERPESYEKREDLE